MTSNYNRDALEAYRNGELDLALFYANNSLRLDSTQPEMHRLRSAFSSEATDKDWERSLHQRILMREIEFVPANTLDPEPTPDFDVDEAPSHELPEDPSPKKQVSAPKPPAHDDIVLSLNSQLAGASFGSSTDPTSETTQTTESAGAVAVAESGSDEE